VVVVKAYVEASLDDDRVVDASRFIPYSAEHTDGWHKPERSFRWPGLLRKLTSIAGTSTDQAAERPR
jgi:hypothetical protein